MDRSGWKDRIYGMPGIGDLIAGLRGVMTLRRWRDDMRGDIDTLRMRLDAVEPACRELTGQLGTRLDDLSRRADECQGGLDAQRAHFEALLRGLDARASRGEARAARLAEQVAGALERCEALSADLAFALRELRTPGDAASAGGLAGSAATAPGAAPLDDDTEARRRAPFADLLPGVAGEDPAAVLALHAWPASAWIDRLAAQPPGSLGAVLALDGTAELGPAMLAGVLDHALRALRPDGVWISLHDNPENLLVAQRLLLADDGSGALSPQRAERALMAAGFGARAIRRLDAEPDSLRLPGEGAAVERLNQLLCGPVRFAAVGWKAG